jgi:hypothetical protein
VNGSDVRFILILAAMAALVILILILAMGLT